MATRIWEVPGSTPGLRRFAFTIDWDEVGRRAKEMRREEVAYPEADEGGGEIEERGDADRGGNE